MSIGTERQAFADGNRGERAGFVRDEHLSFLDDLRLFSETNMFGAAPYLQGEFPELTREQAREVLGYWMKTFGGPSR